MSSGSSPTFYDWGKKIQDKSEKESQRFSSIGFFSSKAQAEGKATRLD